MGILCCCTGICSDHPLSVFHARELKRHEEPELLNTTSYMGNATVTDITQNEIYIYVFKKIQDQLTKSMIHRTWEIVPFIINTCLNFLRAYKIRHAYKEEILVK